MTTVSFSGPTRVSITEEEFRELEFLRYFYSAAGDAFGPAESDIYHSIKRYSPNEDEN